MTPATSGPPSSQAFAHYDPDSSSWKTWPAISLWGLVEFSGTWPKRGTTRNGFAYELPTSAPHTDAPACSSLLPTPTAQEPGGTAEQYRARWRRSDGRESTFLPLSMVAPALLPTPLASDGEKGGPNQRGGAGDLRLSSAVQLLPTPPSSCSTGAGEHGDGGDNLQTAVTLLPTPNTQNGRESGLPRDHRADLTAALISRGAPTSPPSDGGSESWDAQPLDLLTLDATDGNDCPPGSSSS